MSTISKLIQSGRAYIMCEPPQSRSTSLAGRTLLYFLLLFWGIPFILNPLNGQFVNSHFLHGPNLIIHEAGHIVCMPFGPLIMSMGGSILQLFIPLLLGGVLLIHQRDCFGAAVGLWWFAQNWFDIAPYTADARAREMILLGGRTGKETAYGYHDWEFILSKIGLLNHDIAIAQFFYFIGVCCMILSYMWAAALLYAHWQQDHPRKPRRSRYFSDL
ncbi:MAG: zinc ribbon domain-containing protein [Fibrobacterota bacterium]